MLITSASFVKSSSTISQCPVTDKPEFGFIGRSNVGKSSLINMITGWGGLAKVSGHPGRTRTINHFLINDSWYIVDLPGYGYAKVPIKMRDAWIRSVREYILKRENLVCLFVLLDSRHEPQASDLAFMDFLGVKSIPFARVFTKSDKLSPADVQLSIRIYDREMLKVWETLPYTFVTSTVKKSGKDEILDFIEETINNFLNSV
jgi:GTP-binding protein